MSKQSDVERQQAIERLQEHLKAGDTVYTILRHRSRSGMQRVIQVVHFEYGNANDWGYNAAEALGLRYDRVREGVVVSGCGLDMGFHLVYELSRLLFPHGFGVPCRKCGERPIISGAPRGFCGETGRKPHDYFVGRNGDKSGWDSDGGYALHRRRF